MTYNELLIEWALSRESRKRKARIIIRANWLHRQRKELWESSLLYCWLNGHFPECREKEKLELLRANWLHRQRKELWESSLFFTREGSFLFQWVPSNSNMTSEPFKWCGHSRCKLARWSDFLSKSGSVASSTKTIGIFLAPLVATSPLKIDHSYKSTQLVEAWISLEVDLTRQECCYSEIRQ